MNSTVHLLLSPTSEQSARLTALQSAFAEVCNALAPVVQQTRCWNRVGLHHLAYRSLRERFPQVGSQMICNAIYSVSRTCRLILQHPSSPFNVSRNPGAPLPLLRFLPSSPVYFDRHTLSLKGTELSMYTLDGRMKFQAGLEPEMLSCFQEKKLREIVLAKVGDRYRLSFTFSTESVVSEQNDVSSPTDALPEYVLVLPPDGADVVSPSSGQQGGQVARLSA